MPLPSGAVEFSFEFTGAPVPLGAVTTLATTLPGPGPDDVIAIMSDIVQPLHEAISSIYCELSTISMKVGPEASGPTFVGPGPGFGAQSGDVMAPQVAVLVRKENFARSARYNGRMYWPAVPVAGVNGAGNLDGDYVTQIQDELNTFYDALLTELDATPLIVPAVGSDTNPVTRLVCDSRVASQRRRNRR